MKRLFLVLMCVVLCFSLCGCFEIEINSGKGEKIDGNAHESARNVALSAAKAYYIDLDPEAYFEVSAPHNYELAEKYLDGYELYNVKDRVSSMQEGTKESIKRQWKTYLTGKENGGTGAENLKVSLRALTVDEYGKDTNVFSTAVEGSQYGEAVSKIAKVDVLVKATYTLDGDSFTQSSVRSYACYCIGSKWYIG